MTINLPFNYLKAVALFASRSWDRAHLAGVRVEPYVPKPTPESDAWAARHNDTTAQVEAVLLVGVDGVTIAVLLHELGFPIPAFAPFTIPLDFIDTIQLRSQDGDKRVTLTCDGDTVSINEDGDERTFVWKLRPQRFPEWRSVFKLGPRNELGRVGILQGRYLERLGEAAELLGKSRPSASNAITLTGYGRVSPFDGNPTDVVAQMPDHPNFTALVRVVRKDSDAVAKLPAFVS